MKTRRSRALWLTLAVGLLAGDRLRADEAEAKAEQALWLRRGHVVSRTEIEAHIYSDSTEVMSNVVDSAVCLLRKKITLPDAAPIIQTRRGMGYILESARK